MISGPAARVTPYVWGIAAVAALGDLLFGYDWVVIGGARQFYEIYFGLVSDTLIGWANSCALVGCLIGSLAAGSLADRFGRRRVLLAAAVLFAVSSAFTGLAHTFLNFIVWRIAGGTAIGLSSNVSPLYIAEISPAAIRGKLVSLNQFAIVVGILLAQIFNWLIARPLDPRLSRTLLLQTWNVQRGWRWMFFAVVVPATIFTVTSIFLPESPRWLLVHNRTDDASRVLERIGGRSYAAFELIAIKRSLANSAEEKSSWMDLLHPGIFGPGATRRVKRYEPTEAGKKYFQQVSVVLGQSAGFCYGDRTVDSIVKWTEPVTMGASSQTEVTYTYKIANLAPWAERSDVQREFGDVRTIVNGISKSNEIAGLQLSNQGWEVPRQ
jgi:MFS family permease